MLVQANCHRNSKSILWHPSTPSVNAFHQIDKEFLLQLLSICFFQIFNFRLKVQNKKIKEKDNGKQYL